MKQQMENQIGFIHNAINLTINRLSINKLSLFLIKNIIRQQNQALKKTLFTLFIILQCTLIDVFAQVQIDGFFRNYNAVTITDNTDYLIGRNRIELNFTRNKSDSKVYLSTQALNLYSDSLGQLDFRIREAYFEFYRGNYDIRIGQQLLPIGETTAFFLNDVLNPIDVSEFLTQEIRDIRIGIPAIKVTRYFDSDYLDIIFTPVFSSYKFSQPDSPFFPFENLTDIGPFDVSFGNSLDQRTSAEPQAALRYAYNRNIKFDIDLYAMYWFNANSAFSKEIGQVQLPGNAPQPQLQLDAQFQQSMLLGMSGSYILSDDIILKGEFTYIYQRYFDYFTDNLKGLLLSPLTNVTTAAIVQEFQQNSDGFLLTRPYSAQMLGIQYNIKGWTIESQFVNEYIFNYDEQILQDEFYSSATLLLQKQFLRDKLGFRLFSRYNFNASDYWFNPELDYEVSDGLTFQIGTQVFGGKDPEAFYGHFSFENYSDISFGYLKLTSYF